MVRIKGKKDPYKVYRSNTGVYRNSAIPYFSKDLEKFLSNYEKNDNKIKVKGIFINMYVIKYESTFIHRMEGKEEKLVIWTFQSGQD